MAWSHPKHKEILTIVRDLKLEGKTVPAICHALSRAGYRAPGKARTSPSWQACHIIDCLQELRKRGELPEAGLFLQVKAVRDGDVLAARAKV